MAIRKILLPLQAAVTTDAAFTTAAMVARMWNAHLAVLHVAADRAQEDSMRALFERLVAERGLAVAEAKPSADTPSASFAALIGREPDVVAYQARTGRCRLPGEAGRRDRCGTSGKRQGSLFL
jgi:hypothetical protein